MGDQRTYEIEGMTCDHCATSLQDALSALPGVASAAVSFSDRRADVTTSGPLADEAVRDAAGAKGYCARRVSPPSNGKTHSGDGTDFDLVIIGSGSAAFAAALSASERGARVAMVERGTIGGTCVNVGCVPSKALLRAADALHRARETPFAGLSVQGELRDFRRLMAQKDALVSELRQGKYVDVLAATDVEFVRGEATFVSGPAVSVAGRTLRAPRYLIATGARPVVPEIPGLAASGFLTSTDALELEELPGELLVLGGRYVALELAQAFARLGSRVTVLQRSSHILPTEDDDVTAELAGYLRAEGIDVGTGTQVREVRRDGGRYRVSADVGGKSRSFEGSHLLAALGRRPNTETLGLDSVGVKVTDDGAIEVDDTLATTAPGIYAVGDVIGDPSFVYTAAYEGRLAAANALSGSSTSRDYTALPWVVFTDPQVAGVGLNEKSARTEGVAIDVARLPLSYVPRALAARDTRGFLKLIKEQGGDRLLGASILAPEAGDIIMGPALAIRHGITVSDLADAFHPYLTQAEGVRLAAQTFHKDVSALSCCA